MQIVGTALAAVREKTKFHGAVVGNAVLSVPKNSEFVISDRLRL